MVHALITLSDYLRYVEILKNFDKMDKLSFLARFKWTTNWSLSPQGLMTA